MAAFTIREQGRPDRVFRLDLPRVTVGRTRTANLVLPNASVSRRHAQIMRSGEGYVVIDLESQNGTFVNGKRVRRHQLHSGDELQVGKFLLTFYGDDDRMAGATDLPAYNIHAAKASSAVTDYVALSELEKMRKSFALRDRGQVVGLDGEKGVWRPGDHGVQFGGRDGIPVKAHGFGSVADIRWDGRRHVLQKTSMLATITVNNRPISTHALRPGDRFDVGKTRFIYQMLPERL